MTKPLQPEIVIATSNAGKIAEIREALSLLPVRLRELGEFPNVLPVEEVGQTYEDNAALKALSYAQQTGMCALADDSGLEVDALNGKPGVLSARFGGQHLSDRERTEKLLAQITDVRDLDRSARFVCSMALAGWHAGTDNAQVAPKLLSVTEGVCSGVLTSEARGANGFGFDPIFVPNGYDRTFAELPSGLKSKISHRGKALNAMRLFLIDWLAQLDHLSGRP